MEILSSIGFGAVIGTIIGMLIQHWLNRSMIASERDYNFRKEELLRYKNIAEQLIEKLLLLEDHRDRITGYYAGNYQASQQVRTKFIDGTESLDKKELENNQGQIVASIFLYFPELEIKWNECLNLMKQIFEMRLITQQRMNDGFAVHWQDEITRLDNFNKELGDKPFELCEEIRKIIEDKQKEVKNQKSTFFIS